MPELGKYKKTPRPESIEYFIKVVSSREFVVKVERLNNQLFKVVRKEKSDITVFLTNIYIVSEADVYEITADHGNLNCIVTVSAWNSYTKDAKVLTKGMGIGLFQLKEFLGAIYYDRESFINYEPPKRDEENFIIKGN